MIIVSNSIPKSGSSYRFRCEKALLALSGKGNGQARIERYFRWGFVDRFNLKTCAILLFVNFTSGGFVVKTHARPNKYLKRLSAFGLAAVTFSYRHPFDVILSAMDHHRKSKAGIDKTGAFLNHADADTSAEIVKNYFKNYFLWSKIKKTILIRYEDFVSAPEEYLKRLNAVLKLGVGHEDILRVVSEMESRKQTFWNFNKGETFRYIKDADPALIEKWQALFADELKALDY